LHHKYHFNEKLFFTPPSVWWKIFFNYFLPPILKKLFY
jgi:hypothetical protein